MIHFACPRCRTRLKAKDDKVGRSTHCPKCQSSIKVPTPQGESVPSAALDRSPSISDSNELEPDWDQQQRKLKSGFLMLSLFVSGLVCGTLVFLVIIFKIKEAKLLLPRVAHAKQAGKTAGEPPFLQLPPKWHPLTELPEEDRQTAHRTDPVPQTPLPVPGSQSAQMPGKEIREPKVEEYDIQPRKTMTHPVEETPASSKPPAQPLEDTSLKASEALVAPLIKDLKHQRVADRLKAIGAVAQLGPRGKAASRALCESLLDSNTRVRLAAAEALDRVNPALHRLVIPIMVDKELENRLECARKIGELGPEGKPAVPVVVYFKQQYRGGGLTVEVLAAIAPDDKAVTAKVAAWLTSDNDPYVRLAAVKVLPHMAGAKDHVRALVQVLRGDAVDAVRAAAASALGDLGADTKDADRLLRMAKTDASAQVREAAERALEKMQKK